jgi:UPF0716 protein FxsA
VRLLFFIFLTVPIIEMVLLIKVGGLIGALPTVALVMLTALIGVAMFRKQGFLTLQRIQEKLIMGELPGQELIEGAMLLIGGALLLTPGFFTDAIGFICLIPMSRRSLAKMVVSHSLLQPIMSSGSVFSQGSDPFSTTTRKKGDVYEGEYHQD